MAEAMTVVPPTAAEEKPDQLAPAPGVTRPRVFFDISIDDNDIGKIVFELFSVSVSFSFAGLASKSFD